MILFIIFSHYFNCIFSAYGVATTEDPSLLRVSPQRSSFAASSNPGRLSSPLAFSRVRTGNPPILEEQEGSPNRVQRSAAMAGVSSPYDDRNTRQRRGESSSSVPQKMGPVGNARSDPDLTDGIPPSIQASTATSPSRTIIQSITSRMSSAPEGSSSDANMEVPSHVSTAAGSSIQTGIQSAENCNSGIHERYNPDLGFYDFRFVLGSYIDYLPFYTMRSQICRMAHHPSDLGHFLAAEQVGYQFLRETINVLKYIKEKNTEQGLNELYIKATKKYSLPPETKIPGCRIGGEERLPICWTSFRPQSGPSLYDIVEDYQGWKVEERFSPYEKERHEYGFRDEHKVIEGHQESGWLTLKPVTVTPEIVKNHDDGTAWLTVCNGMLRYCEKKKGKACTSWDVKDDVQFKINGEPFTFTNTYERFEAGAKRDTTNQLGRWLPFHTSTTDTYKGMTDHVNMRSGYCLALKNVPPGDYQIQMRVVNKEVRTWLTHVMIL